MATGYYSQVYDTVVSGSALISDLSPAETRSIALKGINAFTPLPDISGATVALTSDYILQAALRTQGFRVASGVGTINVGSDLPSVAAGYISLFNLRSTNDVRVLRFTHQSGANNTALASVSGTHVYVNVALTGGADAASVPLFINGNIVGVTQSNDNGNERIVHVSAVDLTSGAQVVRFTITPFSV